MRLPLKIINKILNNNSMKSLKIIVTIFLGSIFFILIISWIGKANSIKNLVKINNVAQEYKGTASITQV